MVAVNGDVLSGTDLKSLIERHKETEALATITLTSVEDPTAYGLVEVDHDMVVRRFIEKPAADEVTTNLVNAGIYVLEPEVLEMIPPGREVSIEREIFPELCWAGCGRTSRAPTGGTSGRRAATSPPATTCLFWGGGGPAREVRVLRRGRLGQEGQERESSRRYRWRRGARSIASRR